jgi:NAD(P)-dependent dehydrogenase (short-subunit alcohol dehydrogenase family)
MKELIALVTGASRGLGREIALLLVEKGYRTCAGVRNIDEASKTTIHVRRRYN